MATITLNIQLSGSSKLLSAGSLNAITTALQAVNQATLEVNRNLLQTSAILTSLAANNNVFTNLNAALAQAQAQAASLTASMSGLVTVFSSMGNASQQGSGAFRNFSNNANTAMAAVQAQSGKLVESFQGAFPEALKFSTGQFQTFARTANTIIGGVQSGVQQAASGFMSFFTTLGGGGLGGFFSGAATIVTSSIRGMVDFATSSASAVAGMFSSTLESIGKSAAALGQHFVGSFATSLGKLLPAVSEAFGAFAGIAGEAVGGIVSFAGAIASTIAESVGVALKGALVSAVFTAYKSISTAGQFEALRPSFAKLTIDTKLPEQEQQTQLQTMLSGGNEQPILDALKELRKQTRGTIPDVELLANANRAAALGAAKDAKEFGKLAAAALNLSRTMGIDAKYALESLTLGIGRQSRLILDNLGIMLKVSDVNERYAKQVGKSAAALTDQEKKTALINEVFRQAEGRLNGLNTSSQTASEAFSATGAAFSNMSISLGRQLLPAFQTIMGGVGRILSVLTEKVESLTEKLKPYVKEFVDSVEPMFQRVVDFITNLTADDIIKFVKMAYDKVKEFIDNFPAIGKSALEKFAGYVRENAATVASSLAEVVKKSIEVAQWTYETFKPLATAVAQALGKAIEETLGVSPGAIKGAGITAIVANILGNLGMTALAVKGLTGAAAAAPAVAAAGGAAATGAAGAAATGGTTSVLAGLGLKGGIFGALAAAAVGGTLSMLSLDQERVDAERLDEAKRQKVKVAQDAKRRERMSAPAGGASTAKDPFMELFEEIKGRDTARLQRLKEEEAGRKVQATKIAQDTLKFLAQNEQSPADEAFKTYLQSYSVGRLGFPTGSLFDAEVPSADKIDSAKVREQVKNALRNTDAFANEYEKRLSDLPEETFAEIEGRKAIYDKQVNDFNTGVRKAVEFATGQSYEAVVEQLGITEKEIADSLFSPEIKKLIKEGKTGDEQVKDAVSSLVAISKAEGLADVQGEGATKDVKATLGRIKTELGQKVNDAIKREVEEAQGIAKVAEERLKGLEAAAEYERDLVRLAESTAEKKADIDQLASEEIALVRERMKVESESVRRALEAQRVSTGEQISGVSTLLPIAKAKRILAEAASKEGIAIQRGAFPGATAQEIAALGPEGINKRIAEAAEAYYTARGATMTAGGRPLYGELTLAERGVTKAQRDLDRATAELDKAKAGGKGYGEASLKQRAKEKEAAEAKLKAAKAKAEAALEAAPGALEEMGGPAAALYTELVRRKQQEVEERKIRDEAEKKKAEVDREAERERKRMLDSMKDVARTLGLSIEDLLKNWGDHVALRKRLEELRTAIKTKKAAEIGKAVEAIQPTLTGTTGGGIQQGKIYDKKTGRFYTPEEWADQLEKSGVKPRTTMEYVAPMVGGTTPTDYGANATMISLLKQIRDCVCECQCPTPGGGGNNAPPRPGGGGGTTAPFPPAAPQAMRGGTTPGGGGGGGGGGPMLPSGLNALDMGQEKYWPMGLPKIQETVTELASAESASRRTVARGAEDWSRGMGVQIDLLRDMNDKIDEYSKRAARNQRGIIRSLDTTNKTVERMISVEEGLAGHIRGLSSDAANLYNRLGNLEVAVFRARGGFGAVDLLRVRSTGASIGAFAPSGSSGGGYYTAG